MTWGPTDHRTTEPEQQPKTATDELAREIRRLRTEAELSQRMLASKIGYSRQYVTMTEWEDANLPSQELVTAIDAALGAGGRLIALRERADAERRSQRDEGVDNTSLDPGGDTTNRREALRGLGVGLAAGTGLRDLVLGASQESSRLSVALNRPPIAADTIEDIAEDLRRVATDYVLVPDLRSILVELVSLRDGLATHLDYATRPSDIREIYVLLAATCALLGSVSHDLAEPNAAFTQARSAATFANLAGHRSLESWAYCTRAMIASWWSTPASVLAQVRRAGDAHGIAAVRLSGLAARAYAELGDRDSAQRAIDRAYTDKERLSEANDLSDFGAVFSFSVPRQHYYNAMAYAELGDWSMVASEANKTISLYSPVRSQAWPTTLTLAQTNLARALLHIEGPDAALEGLQPVLEIPEDQRIPQVTSGMQRLSSDLGQRKTRASRELEEAIRSFKPIRSGAD